jgi:O-antigen/teichoic acid export membrane protein
MFMAGTGQEVVGPDFLASWIGPDFAGPSGAVLRVLMASFLVYLPVRGVALPVLLGLGKARAPALTLLAMGVLNLGLSLALVGPFGILGVAIGTSIPNVMFAGVLLTLACRELGMAIGSWVAYVATRATIGALVPLGVFLASKLLIRVSGMPSLVAAGCVGTIAFAAVWILFVQRGDPHFDLREERSA